MCRHGILIAFWFLGEPESPKTFFDFIVGRYKTAPRMVVYDHSCGLSAYALNRIPLFFRNTRFRIDKFHWRNHIACSEAFDFSSYCKSNPKEYDLNTNEVNSCLPLLFSPCHSSMPSGSDFPLRLNTSIGA